MLVPSLVKKETPACKVISSKSPFAPGQVLSAQSNPAPYYSRCRQVRESTRSHPTISIAAPFQPARQCTWAPSGVEHITSKCRDRMRRLRISGYPKICDCVRCLLAADSSNSRRMYKAEAASTDPLRPLSITNRARATVSTCLVPTAAYSRSRMNTTEIPVSRQVTRPAGSNGY